ncbi:MAG: GspE/PulE family protein [Planctomycetota bacterium]
MPFFLLSSIEYGGYISIAKFIIFLICFFTLLPFISWVYRDAEAVGTKETFWTTIVFGTVVVATIIWFIVPIFIIGMLFYLIVVGAASISYVMHRNARVMDFDRVLTAEHLKGLFANEEKKLDTLKELIFITANNNEVPLPQAKTPDFFGYRAAYDIFTDAIWRRTSDIIFSPAPEAYNAIYYVDGLGLKQPSIPRDKMEYFILFLKNLADLDVNERRKPQKGKFRIHQKENDTVWEITAAGSTAGEQIHIRNKTQQDIAKLNDIGLAADQLEQLNKIRDANKGLFIISGPQKMGVSTTFYALIRNHDPFLFSVNTLEKETTVELPNITQTTYTLSDTGTTTYARKLQEIVRMGADVIGVADCTDAETAKVAIDAAKEGKIVYVTIAADSVVKALGKWMKLVGRRSAVTKTLLGICNQRLVRKLCNECKQAYEPNRDILRKFNLPAEKVKVLYRAGKVMYSKRGKPTTCENCQGTGFVGRTGAFEIIIMNENSRKAIKESKTLQDIGRQFRREKMLYLQEQAMKKVINGTTAMNETK